MRSGLAGSIAGGAMIRRRELLGGGTALAVATALPAIAGARAPIMGFVADTRFAAARHLPTPAGAWRHEIDGDVTSLWYERLDQAWRRPGAAIAGATGEDALFVLEHLAWDRRRRIVRRERVAGGDGGAPLVRWLIDARQG